MFTIETRKEWDYILMTMADGSEYKVIDKATARYSKSHRLDIGTTAHIICNIMNYGGVEFTHVMDGVRYHYTGEGEAATFYGEDLCTTGISDEDWVKYHIDLYILE
jgi:hypothetical protein